MGLKLHLIIADDFQHVSGSCWSLNIFVREISIQILSILKMSSVGL